MKKILLLSFFILAISLLNTTIALAEGPKNYFKGKFYTSVKNHFLIATKKMIILPLHSKFVIGLMPQQLQLKFAEKKTSGLKVLIKNFLTYCNSNAGFMRREI